MRRMMLRWAGKDCTHEYAKLLYEPLYPVVDKREDMPQEHCDWVEDFIYNPDVNTTTCAGLLVPEQEESKQS